MKPTLLLRLWLGLTRLAPGLPGLLARRAHRRQGADPARLPERFGHASLARPGGRLIWIHAASVGEVVSVSALARRIADLPGLQLLVTTATATGAATVARHLPGALHQFLPVDTPGAVGRFLGHWRPDAALFVEGDFWPRMMLTLARQAIPVALLNARASKTRERVPRSMAVLLAGVDLVTVQAGSLRAEFLSLGIDQGQVHSVGNLKADIPSPVVDDTHCAALRRMAAGRPVWAAALTHPGEEEIVLEALAALDPAPLLLLAPRHPDRADAISAGLQRRGLRFSRHSAGQGDGPPVQVHLIDALGLMGDVYSVADLALIGGSLVEGPGGHAPYEAAAIGCPMLTGPHLRNARADYDALLQAGAVRLVRDAGELGRAVSDLLGDPAALAAMRDAARAEQQRHAGATGRVLDLLTPILAPPTT
ncbi:3-deoxy-D-manno-octulosonic acid transferase [Szabonella alba]|uniref:3-deoxy-D-manno-octulosonic acid transferase n=1 Tax=Szabonella alba TaxID=2804194 RepID=A0A8K0XZU9_9RHOB|nr:glycosyltransferase N-terminal domain-containing protein [Szabonella alba]MBL4916428.1 hypothetical protein [Szabonella alba]